MPLTLADIPDHFEAPAGAAPTRALRDVSQRPARRRSVIRGIALGALTVGASVATFATLDRRSVARAETGPGGLLGWDRNDCRDAFANGYTEQRDNVGAYTGRQAACYGGNYMGSIYCKSGWHRSDTVHAGPSSTYYRTRPYSCSDRNAWRWTTPDGSRWRCSDGTTTIVGGSSSLLYYTTCRAPV